MGARKKRRLERGLIGENFIIEYTKLPIIPLTSLTIAILILYYWEKGSVISLLPICPLGSIHRKIRSEKKKEAGKRTQKVCPKKLFFKRKAESVKNG